MGLEAEVRSGCIWVQPWLSISKHARGDAFIQAFLGGDVVLFGTEFIGELGCCQRGHDAMLLIVDKAGHGIDGQDRVMGFERLDEIAADLFLRVSAG